MELPYKTVRSFAQWEPGAYACIKRQDGYKEDLYKIKLYKTAKYTLEELRKKSPGLYGKIKREQLSNEN